jgi:hypothetical protein
MIIIIFSGSAAQRGLWSPRFTGFLITSNDAPQSVGLPLDEWSARRRDLYLITYNTHNRKTSMPSVGFEPTIAAGERPQTAQQLGPALIYDKT